jgi:hypothetical protein
MVRVGAETDLSVHTQTNEKTTVHHSASHFGISFIKRVTSDMPGVLDLIENALFLSGDREAHATRDFVVAHFQTLPCSGLVYQNDS